MKQPQAAGAGRGRASVGLLGSRKLSPTQGPLSAPCSLAPALLFRFYSLALPRERVDFRAREYVVQENLQVGYSLETS